MRFVVIKEAIMFGEELHLTAPKCPKCGNTLELTSYRNPDVGFDREWECNHCNTVWKDTQFGSLECMTEDASEMISVDEAADIWLSNGKDPDYMFGYSAEELEEQLEK